MEIELRCPICQETLRASCLGRAVVTTGALVLGVDQGPGDLGVLPSRLRPSDGSLPFLSDSTCPRSLSSQAAHLESSLGSQFPCPVCGEQTAISEAGVKVDRVLKLVVETFQQTKEAFSDDEAPPKCGLCEEKLASQRCLTCDGVLCEDCVQATHSRGYFRSHQIVDLRNAAGQVSSRMVCQEHSQSLDFYCLECRTPVCSHCSIFGEHRDHQKTNLDKAVQTGKETLQAWIDRLSQRITSAEVLLETFHEADKEITQRGEAQRAIVNNEMDHLRELIETKRRQLLQKSALEEKQKRVQLQAQVNRAEGIRSEAKGFVDRSEGLLGLDSEHAFLAVVLPLIQDMKACAGTAVDNNRHISTAFRPLSTDAQVRVLGDLDLGHRLQPAPMLAGPCQSLEPVPFVPQSYQQPREPYVQAPAQHPAAAPNGGAAHLPPTAAHLNGAFAQVGPGFSRRVAQADDCRNLRQVASHVQLVYRASVYPT
ncbi:TRIM45 [Symbiodinium necroappetens]|uniref:TRIM45 protein n=1 Tax=Symbiodinium necroappetens TaxID=1628268 RepID=A0A812JXK8_9DINO|nr:TRIM45 [Symbiodinium necroappetens]